MTTVLDQVLTVEKEAAAAIATARDAAAAAVAEARTEQAQTLETTKERLKKAHTEALEAEATSLEQSVADIDRDAASKIAETQSQFAAKKDDIVAAITTELLA